MLQKGSLNNTRAILLPWFELSLELIQGWRAGQYSTLAFFSLDENGRIL